MQRKDHLDSIAISLLLGCCLFWGFQQVLVKATVAEVAEFIMPHPSMSELFGETVLSLTGRSFNG